MSDRTTVQIIDNPDHHRVEARTDDGRFAGFSQYYVRDGAYVFFHTEVDDAFEGHGIGSQIAAGVIDFVRGRGMPLVPECDFVRAYVAKHPESQDVLAPDYDLESAERS